MNRIWKLIHFILLILVCLGLNYAGEFLTKRFDLPFWLDSVGTVLCAGTAGPVCGAMVGVTMNLLFHIVFGEPWIYGLVSIEIAAVVGVMSQKRKLKSVFDMLNVAAIMSIGATIIAVPLNFIFGNGSTGNLYGDAVIGFMTEQGIPDFLSKPVGQLYVEMLDKVITMLVLYLLQKGYALVRHLLWGRKEQEEKLEQAIQTLAVLMTVGLCLTAAPAAVSAEGVDDIKYNDYVQTVYARQNGLPVGEANDIAQTKDGILWVGTYAGLYRYNGREFKRMDYDSVFNVNCLYVDEEGRLWIGTNDDGLSIAINEKIVNVLDERHGLPAYSVRSIICSSDGYYYIGTTSSMQIISLDNGLKKLNTLVEINGSDDLAADSAGHVAAVSDRGTLFLLEGGKILCSRQMAGSQVVYKSCTFDSDGLLLAATTGNEIIEYDISEGWFDEQKRLVCGDLKDIKDLRFIENGYLFVSADNGIGYFNTKKEFVQINTKDFSTSIDHMLVDYQGNLWFTSSRLGLLRMARSDFRDIYGMAGLERNVVNTMVFWQDICYIGTDKGLDAVDLKERCSVENALTKQLMDARIRCMTVDRQGSLWICTYANGVLEVTADGTQYVYNKENSGVGNQARVVRELQDGTIVAAGNTGLSFIRNHEVEDTILYSNGQFSAKILTVTEMPDGRILAGTDGDGLAVLKDRQIEKVLERETDGLSSSVILRTVLDPVTGGAFVVTSNGLCYLAADNTVRRLTNFPYFNNYDIFVKDLDTLFVLSSAGIYVVNREELLSGKEDIAYELLDTRRGLNSSLTANSWTWYDETTGDLFLACDSGVYVVNTDSYSSGTKVYRMSVHSVKTDDYVYQLDHFEPIRIARGSNYVDLSVEILNYTIQDPNVGYYLEGFDKTWKIVPQNNLGVISYTNLPSGTYTFHLAVFDNHQEHVVTERTYTLIKEKELYDNPWFILYLLSVPMLTVGWVTWLLVKRHERKMEARLAEAQKLVEMGKQTVIAIARTVDAKDPRTGGHSKRVALYSKQIAEAYGLSVKECQEIEWSAQMHDIGKIGIPDAILNKPSRLTDEEYAVMKSHTTRGAEILSDFTLLDHVIEGAEFHHERYDGRGYPKGLKAEEIPLYARIIGVADAFDAMTANRIYRKQMDFGYVLDELEKGRGTQFDPTFADILLKLIREGTIDLNKIYHVPKEQEETEAEKSNEAKAQEQKPTDEKPAEKKPEKSENGTQGDGAVCGSKGGESK